MRTIWHKEISKQPLLTLRLDANVAQKPVQVRDPIEQRVRIPLADAQVSLAPHNHEILDFAR